jgi:signal peptidase I
MLNNKKKILILIFLLSFAIFIWAINYIANNIIIICEQNIDNHLFIKTNGEIKVNDYVVYYIPGDPIIGDRKISHRVVCQGGQILKIVVDDYFCDEEYIGKAVRETKEGVPIEPYNPCIAEEKKHSPFEFYRKDVVNTKICEYKIPDGYYFVAGTHPRSYDSRYFGLISKKEIISKIEPLL